MTSSFRLVLVLLAMSHSGCGTGAASATDGSTTDGSTTDGGGAGDGAAVASDLGTDGASQGSGNLNLAGSCTITSGGAVASCTEYGEAFMANVVMMGCAGGGATYSTADCPTANRVGHCDITAIISGRTTTESISYYPPSTTARAMQQCTDENSGHGMTAVFTAD